MRGEECHDCWFSGWRLTDELLYTFGTFDKTKDEIIESV